MSESVKAVKAEKKQKTIDDQIASLKEKLKTLEDQKRESNRKEQEKNKKAVLEILSSEKLDVIPSEKWQAAIPAIKRLLTGEEPDKSEAKQDVPVKEKPKDTGKAEKAVIPENA